MANTTGSKKANNTTTALAASLIVKAAAGTLYGLTVTNTKDTAQYIQLHDSATLVADTAVPIVAFEIAADTCRTLDFGASGRAFTAGIVACNSSTNATKTIGSADCLFDAQFS